MVGDLPVSYANYITFQDLLEDLKTIQERYSEGAWIQASQPRLGHNANMVTARSIRGLLPTIVRASHITIAGLISQLSLKTRECLEAGLLMKKIEDNLYNSLQEANFAFLGLTSDFLTSDLCRNKRDTIFFITLLKTKCAIFYDVLWNKKIIPIQRDATCAVILPWHI